MLIVIAVIFSAELYAADRRELALMEDLYQRYSLPLPGDSVVIKEMRRDRIIRTPEGRDLYLTAFVCCCCDVQRLKDARAYYYAQRRPEIEQYVRGLGYSADFMRRFDAYTTHKLNDYAHVQAVVPENRVVLWMYNFSAACCSWARELAREVPISSWQEWRHMSPLHCYHAICCGMCITASVGRCLCARCAEIDEQL
jgi:hypothetical protein